MSKGLDRNDDFRSRLAAEPIDVQAIRKSLGLSQKQFARRYGMSVHTIRKWEQGLRDPETPTKLLLMMIRDQNDVVMNYIDALKSDG